MKRLIVVCEGETEQTFCNLILQPHLLNRGITVQPPLIKSSKGGLVKWPTLKQEIETHLKVDKTAVVTTFIDYYGVYAKHDFPNWEEAGKIPDKNARMDLLETGMSNDISEDLRYRFIPYLQLHEFEGLLFNEMSVFLEQIPAADIVGREELERVLQDFDNPEMINDVKNTSPSHRLARIIKGYHKVVYGAILAEAIGMDRIRSKSPRFNNWVDKLEGI